MEKVIGFIKSKQMMLLITFGIVCAILWNTYRFFEEFKYNEKVKMEIFAEAYVQLNKASINEDISLMVKIIKNNFTIPMIVTDAKGKVLLHQNISFAPNHEQHVLQHALADMKQAKNKIVIDINNNQKQYLYFGNSTTLEKLRYYPVFLVLFLLIFVVVSYLILKNNHALEQNKLWTGMAKETAHQIGTPLSSLMGWVEILKTESVNPVYVAEIEKDIDRLNVIATRFSKIGSKPVLKPTNLVEIVTNTINYFKMRSSKNIYFVFKNTEPLVMVNLNKELFVWVIENLFKNAIDAMQGKGTITVIVNVYEREIELLVTDTGKGVPKKNVKKIFEPGYTTKTRGWGLGLSLTKRIVEDYHHGKLYLKNSTSSENTGATFGISLPYQGLD